MLDAYFRDRAVLHETSEGQKSNDCWGAHGLVLGQDIHNAALYDSLMILEMLKELYLIGFVDGIAILIAVCTADQAWLKLKQGDTNIQQMDALLSVTVIPQQDWGHGLN